MPAKHARKRPMPNYQSFYIKIADWEPSYSFALNDSKHREGPYWEHLELTVSGMFLAPNLVKDRDVKLLFLGSRDDRRVLERSSSLDWKPRNVCVLTVRGEQGDFGVTFKTLQFGALRMLCPAARSRSYISTES